jgi:hypothetical protein
MVAAACSITFAVALISSPSTRAANVAGPDLSLTGAFNVKGQALALPDVVWIDARRLQRADVQKDIRTAGVVSDETESAIGIPHFQGPGSHPIFPFAFGLIKTNRLNKAPR